MENRPKLEPIEQGFARIIVRRIESFIDSLNIDQTISWPLLLYKIGIVFIRIDKLENARMVIFRFSYHHLLPGPGSSAMSIYKTKRDIHIKQFSSISEGNLSCYIQPSLKIMTLKVQVKISLEIWKKRSAFTAICNCTFEFIWNKFKKAANICSLIKGIFISSSLATCLI
ncbi:unnamed protein product [Moneuplotes crassus]|uniref:Uncharacterized protein n=1 Tax=Euplotes crassus TaxID=5936 RepID=A0AAD1Y4N7_EUPCR|nr:unnamed protein product [Moneuplotes crassus]